MNIKMLPLLIISVFLVACGAKEYKYEDIPTFSTTDLNQFRTQSGTNAMTVFARYLRTSKYSGKLIDPSCAIDSDIDKTTPIGDGYASCEATDKSTNEVVEFKCTTYVVLPCFPSSVAESKKQYQNRVANVNDWLLERYVQSLKDGSAYGLTRIK